ncbi:FadR/GntR family transcriptional regulator [Bordetella genomosp. 1]|uniref:GntR family transcriptional regulator n=1 Tax=Bordetella genomosp. 1 TaxID=1395607 RepID=A0ABX4F604_9BORD|nr:FadR/GntR family transcriptional regulator [Bordetella genomosp. 1]MDQ8035602.1 FadR/GntR family transcriptional regulator [Bordetella sp.]OZI69185.1 GntR family transcriptional regulator [Bordetella genomosp. 1]
MTAASHPSDPTSARPSLPADLAALLADQIHQGVLAPGDRLPTERELVETHGVSRAVVREAIARLKSEGLVTSQQGRGVFVDAAARKNAFRIAAVSPSDSQELEHILELMLAIETTAARYAAQRRSDDDLKRIRQGLVGMEYAVLNDKLGDDEDYAFHQAIVQATHNPHLVALNEYLEGSVRHVIRSARRNTAHMYAQRMADVQREHQAIYSAIADADPQAAGAAAERHLRNAAERLRLYRDDAAD